MSCTTLLHSFFIRAIYRVICIYLKHMWNRWNMAVGWSGVRVNVCVWEGEWAWVWEWEGICLWENELRGATEVLLAEELPFQHAAQCTSFYFREHPLAIGRHSQPHRWASKSSDTQTSHTDSVSLTVLLGGPAGWHDWQCAGSALPCWWIGPQSALCTSRAAHNLTLLPQHWSSPPTLPPWHRSSCPKQHTWPRAPEGLAPPPWHGVPSLDTVTQCSRMQGPVIVTYCVLSGAPGQIVPLQETAQ